MALASILASFPILLLSCISLFCVNGTTYREILRFGQSVSISDTIVSNSGNFELGFFTRTRENSTKYYVGIWFKNVPKDKVVWVANRDYAFQSSSATFTINPDGNIVITDGPMTYMVNSVPNNYSTYAMLLDTGNLVLLSNLDEKIMWQSFDHPTDTLLPGMILVLGYLGDTLSLRSWTSVNDPAPGPFSLEYNSGLASLLVNNGSNVPWIDSSYNRSVQGVIDRMNIDPYFTLPADSNSSLLVLEVSGDLNYQFWSAEAKRWVSLQSSKCGTNNKCGAFSICNPHDLDPCGCLTGFEPFDFNSWRTLNRSAGCVRKKELSCNNISNNKKDRFLQIIKVELPLLYEVKVKMDTSRRCESTCLGNCSCIGYAFDFDGFRMLWHDQVSSLKNISTDNYDGNNDNHTSFFLRLAASELVPTDFNIKNAYDRHGNRKRNLLLIVTLILFLILLVLPSLVVWQRRKRRKGEDLLHFDASMTMTVNHSESTEADKVKKKEVKLPLFSFVSVSAATNNFSDANKLGEGGFGPVYKGKLLNGDEVAVKRLSRRSGQGWERS